MSEGLTQRVGRRFLGPAARLWRRWLLTGSRTEPEDILRVARRIMDAATYCFLATIDEKGQARLRVVQPVSMDSDLTIWIGTHAGSRKVRDIRGASPVTLGFRHGYSYVSLQGRASVVTDEESKRRRWDWRLWSTFPDGDASPDYVLVRFVPERIELLDFIRKVVREPVGLAPFIMVRQGDAWVPADPSGKK